MQRRKFVHKMAWGASLAMLPPTLFARCGDDEALRQYTESVLIIGAGMAGLTAARKLIDMGLSNVTLLEARNRTGGRIWTDRSGGLPFDVGASWIHGPNGNPLTKLAERANAPTFVTDDDNVRVFDATGSAYPDALLDSSEAAYEQLLEDIMAAGSPSQSVEEVLQQLSPDVLADPLRRYELSAYLEFDTGGSLSRLSSKYFYDDESFSGADRILTDGYDHLTDYLAQGLDIRLGEIVTAINYTDGAVTVTTTQGSFTADFAIVTLPLGVLKNGVVNFSPDLPQAKTSAINRLEMGTVNKVLLRWDTPFWDTSLQYIGYTGGDMGLFNYFLNLLTFNNLPALMTFALGSAGKNLEAMTDQQITDAAMANLRTIYGPNIPYPTQMLRSNWNSDPYAFGSYSFAAAGSEPADFAELAASVNDRLFFAGEHTSPDYRGTAHGAYLSGEAAAKGVLAAIG